MAGDPTSLDRLHDIVAPPPVPWWPPATGWCIVLGALALAALALALRALSRWQASRYRREALALMAREETRLLDPACRAAGLASVAEVLKRAALTAFPREEVAGLTGAAWLAFLDRTGGGGEWSGGAGAALARAAHDPAFAGSLEEARVPALVALARRWVREHRAPGGGGPG